jgi:hypothetical protein
MSPITKKQAPATPKAYRGPFATKVSLASVYDDRYADGVAKVELGSVWILDRPLNEHGNGIPIDLCGEMLHKANRPYVVLTDEDHNRKTGLVTVVPATTFSGRLMPPQGHRQKFVVGYDIPLNEKFTILSQKYPAELEIYTNSFASCSGMFTVSIDRFKEYLHSISFDDLQKIRAVIIDELSEGDSNTFQKFFPGYPDPSKQPRKNGRQ